MKEGQVQFSVRGLDPTFHIKIPHAEAKTVQLKEKKNSEKINYFQRKKKKNRLIFNIKLKKLNRITYTVA